MGSKGKSDLNVPMDVEASTPSDSEDDGPQDFEGNDLMDAEDDVEDDVEDNFYPNEDAKMSEDSVVGAVMKKAMRSTSSVTVSKAAAIAKPPVKKVKTEEGADDDTKPMLISLPGGYWIEKRYKSLLNLPEQWPKHFLPTLYLWAGSQDDLWQFTDISLVEALQCIFDVMYPDLKYKVTAQRSVFGVATQRLAEWRSNFGSTGLAIMIDFFTRNEDTNPKDLSEVLMDEFVFLFEEMDYSDSMKAFQSPFMLQLFATAHLHSMYWLPVAWPVGVLAICTTSHKLCTPKTLNKYTGNYSTTEHAFSINNWGSVTEAYLASIKKKGDIYLRDTILTAQKLLKKLGSAGLEKYLRLNDNDESEDIDRRAMLW
ncbi:hypothetical protein EDB19DRAFT_1830039 [Suillus lakei]|nr:hypothetical protein EDB19DRAFT_1830039 [Suillus lakei]